jgi:hypothetical protein
VQSISTCEWIGMDVSSCACFDVDVATCACMGVMMCMHVHAWV